MPEWHSSEYCCRIFDDHENAKKNRADAKTHFSGQHPDYDADIVLYVLLYALRVSLIELHIATKKLQLTLSYSSIWNQNVPQEILFFFRNKYSAIARKRSNTTAIIVRVKI